jgi:hypothetical protein
MLKLQILENTYLLFKEIKQGEFKGEFICNYTSKKDETLHLKLYLDDVMLKDEWILEIKKGEKLEYGVFLETKLETHAI